MSQTFGRGRSKPALAQRLKDGGLAGVCPSHALKTHCLAPRGGRLSHCAVGYCQKHRGISRPESEHATSRQTALPKSQLPTLKPWQDTSLAQRQDSWDASTRLRHLAPGLRQRPAPRGSRGTVATAPECAEHSGPHRHQSGQAGTQQIPAIAAALAACQFPGGLQNPPPDFPSLASSGASVPLSAADCLRRYIPGPSALVPSYILLCQPKSRLKTYGGGRAFSHAAPHLWNALPSDPSAVNSLDFKINLKTYLFKKAFPPSP